MALSIKFSDVSGENVILTRERNSASWKHLYSGGMVFSQLPLQTGTRVKLTVRGTSIVHVGFYNRNPTDITSIKELHRDKKVDLIAQLDVYKTKKCSVHLERTDSSFTYIREDIPYTQNISPGTDVWVAVYIQFGDACVRLYSETESLEPMPFHTTHGKNIQFLDKTRTTAKLHIQNPAATSCIELNPTEEMAVSVTLRLKPCMTGIKTYGLSLLASHSNSKLIRTFNESMFMTDSKIQQQQKCTSIQSFERKSGKFNTCDGELTIKIEHGGKVKYHHDSAGSGSAQVTEQLPQSGGISLILDMLRVTVEIIDAYEYDPRCGSDDEECSSMSSVNSTSVISTCLNRSLNSPTGVSPPFRKQLGEGIVDDLSSIEKTESSTSGLSHTSFKQPKNDSKTFSPTAKEERLDAWVQDTTRFNTPESPTGVRFIFGNDQSVEKTEETVPTDAAPSRKRWVVSPLAVPEVQPKRIRLQNPGTYNKSKTEQSSSLSLIPSIGRTRTWGNEKEDVYCSPNSIHKEIENKTNKTYDSVSSMQMNKFQNTQPHSIEGGLSTEKNEEFKRTSPTNARLESKRSKMGIRVIPPTKTVVDEMESGALVSRRHGRIRTIQHQMTYPDLSAASGHSELFCDEYRVTLQQKATTQHYLKEKIKQNFTTLIEQLVVVPLVDFLYEADILEEDEHDRFSSQKQNSSVNRELLAKLRRKPVNKDKFVAALRKAKLHHLIPMFI